MKVINTTFTTPAEHGLLFGTALVEINGKQAEVAATKFSDGRIYIKGLAVRVGFSGVKVWHGEACMWPTGKIGNLAAIGMDRLNHRGVRLVGFWADVSEAARSQR